ncbi:MAG TPA: hybrid sensor histidine kinase/response regulator [Oscillatoriales cyanobacterium M4454_W2019_049]|nr:hybrid sensor histidine kinase/response regulator [Oscillatoriales cyanobacterium M4454_W2019_049]
MSVNSVKILLIEDNLAEARLLQEYLKCAKFQQFRLVGVQRLANALEELQKDRNESHHFNVILLDLTLPDSQGLASLEPLMRQAPNLPIVVLTNTNDDELAIEAVRLGAQDYLVKRHVTPELLARSLCYAIERKQAAETLREMNESLALENQKRMTELLKAKELNQLKSEFVSTIAHDFRNPMNTILLCSGLLQSSGDRLTEEKKLKHFRLMQSAIKNMAQLLDEVSLMSQSDSGRLEFQGRSMDLVEFCQQLLEHFQLGVGEKHELDFVTNLEAIFGLWDESLLHHILGNLLMNAIKYSPNGGQILLEIIGEEKQVIIRVRDRGIGIPATELPKLFQTFYRASNVEDIPGTGLGLAIAKKCTETHGGTISVESELGIGTTFTVTLPWCRGEAFGQ